MDHIQTYHTAPAQTDPVGMRILQTLFQILVGILSPWDLQPTIISDEKTEDILTDLRKGLW